MEPLGILLRTITDERVAPFSVSLLWIDKRLKRYTPRMNPVQWRGMVSTCRAVAAAIVDRRSRDGQNL